MEKQKNETLDINLTPYVVIRTVFLIVGSVAILGAITKMRTPITLIATAFFLALALNKPVSKISRFMPKGSRALSVAAAYLLVIGFLGALLGTVVPPVTKQISNFANNAPEILDSIEKDPNSNLGSLINKYNLEDDIEKLGSNIQEKLGSSGEIAFRSAQTALGAAFNTITVLVLTFFMLVDGPVMLAGFLRRYKDPEMRKRHENLIRKMYGVVASYFNGQVLVASIASLVALAAMLIGGKIFGTPVPYPLVLAALVWICGLIPMIGATLGASIVVAVSAFTNWKLALVLGIFFVIYQQIENATIQPKVQGKAVSMNPLVVLIVVMLSASLGGIFTAFIALPVAGCLQLLFNDFISEGSLREAKSGTPNNWISRSLKVGSLKK